MSERKTIYLFLARMSDNVVNGGFVTIVFRRPVIIGSSKDIV